MTASTDHFQELDGIRGLLATVVMAYHYGLNTFTSRLTGGVVHDGVWTLCVDVFFALSGFVLCRSMMSRLPTIRGYLVKRWLRLAPAFLLTTFATLLLARGDHGATAIATNLLVVQTFLGQPSINFPAWSVPPELFIPAAGIVVVPLLRRAGFGGSLALLAVVLLAHASTLFLLMRAEVFEADFGRVLRALLGLASGAVMYRVWDLFRPVPSRLRAYAGVAGVLAVMAFGGVAPELVAALPVFVFMALVFGAPLRGVFCSAPMQALGRWSYSIYLAHIPVLLLAQLAIGESAVRGAGPKIALVLATIALSSALYRFVEAPFMNVGRRVEDDSGRVRVPARP